MQAFSRYSIFFDNCLYLFRENFEEKTISLPHEKVCRIKMATVVARRFAVKSFSENLTKFSEKHQYRSPFLISLEATDLPFYLNRGLAQVVLS